MKLLLVNNVKRARCPGAEPIYPAGSMEKVACADIVLVREGKDEYRIMKDRYGHLGYGMLQVEVID